MIKTWKVAATCAVVALVAGAGAAFADASLLRITVGVAGLATLSASVAVLMAEAGIS